jgi:hypothetical protein
MFDPQNLNAPVRVRLRPHGQKILERALCGLTSDWLKPDAAGEITLPLWEMCQIFGSAMANGAPPPIDPDFLIEESQTTARLRERIALFTAAGGEVDHIDGDLTNNTPGNLRIVQRAENAGGKRRLRGLR